MDNGIPLAHYNDSNHDDYVIVSISRIVVDKKRSKVF